MIDELKMRLAAITAERLDNLNRGMRARQRKDQRVFQACKARAEALATQTDTIIAQIKGTT